MKNNVAIKVESVSKSFRLPRENVNSIKSSIINFWRRKRGYEVQQALQNVSFEIKKGEFFGIVGRNGSGKSTLLKLISQIYTPDKGHITVNGKLTPFIELGVGFNPELSGRDNIYLNGALLGFNRQEMDAMYDEIVEFAELERFMDQKLKNYSSGMQVRLAFSIAIRANSDVLVLDEVLAVGDALFQQKCYDYFDKLKKSDKTVVFVSHDTSAIQSFCDRAILINAGEMVAKGTAQEVVYKYNKLLADESRKDSKFSDHTLQHIGAGGAEILRGEIIDSKGHVTTKIAEGEPFSVRIHYKSTEQIDEAVFGLGVMGQQGQSILGPNSREGGLKTGRLKQTGYAEVRFSGNPLSTGTYRIRASIMNTSVTVPYDFVEELTTMTVVGRKRYGDVHVDTAWVIQ